jgi:uncharacterized protein (DUF2141 family)
MRPLRQRPPHRGLAASLVVAALAALAGPAYASAAVLEAGATFPDSVAVGDTEISASVQFTYTGPGKFLPSAIKLTPSCASQALPCSPSDAGVFTTNGTGVGGGVCAGRTFSVSAPTADGTITLAAIPGDSHNPTVDPLEVASGGTCVVNLSLNVIKLPAVDASPAAGLQTMQQAQVLGTSSPDGLAQSASGSDQTTIRKRTPSVSSTAFGDGGVGGQVSDTVTLANAFSPTGMVTFTLFGPNDAMCAGTPAFVSTVSVSSARTTSAPFPATAAGTYRWTVVYSGDVNNDPATAACNSAGATLVVSKAAPGLRVGPLSAASAGAAMRTTATLSGAVAPSGTLTFRVFAPADTRCAGRPLAASTVAVSSNGSYSSAAFTAPSAGTYGWQATYSGDARNESVTSTHCGFPPASNPVAAAAPILGVPRLSPATFRAAGSGPSIAARVGAVVTYSLSHAAKVTFRIERASAGRRVGGRCVKPRRSGRRGKRCIRYSLVSGSFAHAGRAGSNKFKFSGRVHRRKLRPGRYRLRALARDAAGRQSQARRRAFRVAR